MSIELLATEFEVFSVRDYNDSARRKLKEPAHLDTGLELIGRLQPFRFRGEMRRVEGKQQRMLHVDEALETELMRAGAKADATFQDWLAKYKDEHKNRHDIALCFKEINIACEVEKAEKKYVHKDILKCIFYLKRVDICFIFLPHKYFYDSGTDRIFEYGKGELTKYLNWLSEDSDALTRIMLVGYEVRTTDNIRLTKDKMKKLLPRG